MSTVTVVQLTLIVGQVVLVLLLLLDARASNRQHRAKITALEDELAVLREPVGRLVDLARSMRAHKSVLSMGEIRQWELRAHEALTNASIDQLVDQADTVRAVLFKEVKKVAVDHTDAFRPLQEEPSTIGEWKRG